VQRQAQAVEFVFGDVIDFFAAGELAHAAVEIAQRVHGKCVVEAHHRHPVAHLLKSFARRAAHALRGGIGSEQLRVLVFQLLELAHQLVEGRIGNFRVVGHVIEVFVAPDFIAQAFNFLGVVAIL
jgi:hypothetical protein